MKPLSLLLPLALLGAVTAAVLWWPGDEVQPRAGWALRAGTSDRLALLVGIDDYPGDEDDLDGCRRDVEQVERLITSRFGFAPGDVRVLVDEQATVAGVLRAFEELLARARPEAEVLIWYSGHGSRVPDRSGEEKDDWDETLVLHDSRRRGRPGARDLPNDAVRGLLDALAQRTTRLTLVTDACHSGTMRGLQRVPRRARRIAFGEVAVDEGWLRARWPAGLPLDLDGRFDGSGYVHLAACAPHQRAVEVEFLDAEQRTVAMGNLSFHLVDVLGRCAPGTSWQRVALEVRPGVATDNPEQTVWYDGAVEREVFGGGFEAAPAGHPARVVGDTLRVEAGHLHGLRPGAMLRVSANLDGRELGGAEVVSAGPWAAIARWSGAEPDQALRAELVARPPDEPPLKLFVAPGSGALASVGDAQLVADPARADLVLDEGGLYDREGIRLGDAADVAAVIAREAQFQRLRRLHRDPGTLRVSLRLAPPDAQERLALQGSPAELRCEQGIWWASAGTDDGLGDVEPEEYRLATIVIENTEDRPVYVSVLSVGDDRRVQVIYPDSYVHRREHFLNAGETLRAPVGFTVPAAWPLERPYLDRYLVITTGQPTDFTFLEREGTLRGGEEGAGIPTLLRDAFVRLRGESLTPVEEREAFGVQVLDVRVTPE